MKARYIQPAIDALEGWSGFEGEAVVPSTEQEIAAMAARLPGGRIPEAYRELLAYSGRKLGDVYRGVDISYEMAWALLSHDYGDIVVGDVPRGTKAWCCRASYSFSTSTSVPTSRSSDSTKATTRPFISGKKARAG